jgi:glycosyltransferase involved in cell wall biosynthesis
MLIALTTHPIQYQVPVWQKLATRQNVPFEVWYVTDHGSRPSLDAEFGKVFAWDLQTLHGYPHRFLKAANGAAPGSFWRCRIVEDLQARLRSVGARALWIQGWQVAAYWQAALASRRADIPVWLRAESNDLKPVPALKRPLKRAMLSWLFGCVDQFLYIGGANRRLYESYGIPAERLHFAPYAVDNNRFAGQAAALRPSRMEIRRAWGIAADAFCVLFCGKLIEKKRPLDVVEAVARLRRVGSMPEVHLLFAGSGGLDRALRERCAVAFDAEAPSPRQLVPADDPRPRASFAGFLNQTEISRAYVAADCLVLPSDYQETWGLVVNEALASGLACVVSRQSGCAEDLVLPYWPDRVFDSGDVNALAGAIRAAYSGTTARGDLERILDQYSIDRTVLNVERVFLERSQRQVVA